MNPLLEDWLSAQCRLLDGVEAAVVVLGSSAHAPGATAARQPPDATPSPRLAATVEATLERGQLSLQEPGAGGLTDVAVPIRVAGRTRGAVGVSLRGLAAADAKRVGQQLSTGASGLGEWLAQLEESERVRGMLALSTRLLDHQALTPAAHALASALAERFGCERVAVGALRRGRMRLCALSSAIRFREESGAVRDLRDAMVEALEQDRCIELPAGAEARGVASSAHEAWLDGSGAAAVCSVPLGAGGRPVGALCFEWTNEAALDDDTRARLLELATLCGPLLELKARAEASWVERTRAAWLRFAERHFEGPRLGALALGVVAAALVLLALLPGSYRISARASLEGRVQRALVAPVPGYLAEAHARAGDLVQKGDVLARLDDRDLRLEQRKWASQKAQLELEQREALARQDRTQVSILRAQIDQAAAQLGLAEESLARTAVVAPFDGIVLEGDLDRSLGSPVEQGSVLFELAPLDGYRIIVEVDGRDIADVAVGQPGRLTLAALPDRSLPLVVERITPVSTVEDGRNYFRVEANLEEPLAALRPGMEGVAKIDAGRRRLLWIWTHDWIDWLRLATWSLVP